MRVWIRIALVAVATVALVQVASCRRTSENAVAELTVYPERMRKVPGIRILVRDRLDETILRVSGKYQLLAEPSDPDAPALGGGMDAVTVTVRPTVRGLKLGKNEAPYAAICVRPVGKTRVTVNGIDYGGEIVLIRVMPEPQSGAPRQPWLRVVARVDLEQYLIGVVPKEMYPYWPIEALRTQAVASRTYALYKIRTRRHLDFDVRRTAASQVWDPEHRGSPLINLVVNSTRGVVMTDSWRLFPSYFSAQCGMGTKDGERVFVSRAIAPLTGVRCPYCQGEPGGQPQARVWRYQQPVGELADDLRKRGYEVGEVRRLRMLDKQQRPLDSMGRVYDVEVIHERDGKKETLAIPTEIFRYAVGPGKDQIASSCLDAEIRDGTVYYVGRGHGHGVGMCQYGARHLADQGKSYRDILRHYYVGHLLVRLW